MESTRATQRLVKDSSQAFVNLREFPPKKNEEPSFLARLQRVNQRLHLEQIFLPGTCQLKSLLKDEPRIHISCENTKSNTETSAKILATSLSN